MKTAEEIVRALAAADEPFDYDRGYCLICLAYDRDLGRHKQDCPWSMAREWVEAQKNERWLVLDGTPLGPVKISQEQHCNLHLNGRDYVIDPSKPAAQLAERYPEDFELGQDGVIHKGGRCVIKDG